MKYEQYSIQKMLWYYVQKFHPLFHLAHTKYPCISLKKYLSENGVLRFDSRGVYITGTYPRSRNSWKKTSRWNKQFSIYVPMYSTCLPKYLCACIPIMYGWLLYWLLNYLHRSSNLLMHLLTYVHTYVTITYLRPMYLRTNVPIISTYHQRTYKPKNYLRTY
jgi:hypothetical protein